MLQDLSAQLGSTGKQPATLLPVTPSARVHGLMGKSKDQMTKEGKESRPDPGIILLTSSPEDRTLQAGWFPVWGKCGQQAALWWGVPEGPKAA